MPNFSVPNQINPGDASDATKAMANWNQVVNDLNAAKVDNTNIAANAGILADQLADAAKLGISGASVVRRGALATATQEARTNVAYGLLTTADRIQNVVVPTNGILCVSYRALWLPPAAAGVGRAAIFIGSNQLQASTGAGAAAVQEALAPGGDGTHYAVLATTSDGIAADTNTSADATIPSTGWSIGPFGGAGTTSASPAGTLAAGHVEVDVAAGTYDISIQFKSSSGTVTVKNRLLRVWTIGF